MYDKIGDTLFRNGLDERPEESAKSTEFQNMIKKFKKSIMKNNCTEEENNKKISFYSRLSALGEKINSYYRYIWNGNFSSPVEEKLRSGAKVLDLGCVHGYWLLELSNEYPMSNFVGINLIPAFHSDTENLKFIEHDFLKGIPYEDNTFDFIHMVIMLKHYSDDDWRTLIPEIFRVCKHGGWIEIMDMDPNTYNKGPNTSNFHEKHLKMIGDNLNISRSDLSRIQDIMNNQELGVTLIREKINAWYPFTPPNSDEPFELVTEVLDAYYPFISNLLELNREDYTKLSQKIVEEIAEYKSYSKTFRMITQKKIQQ